MVPMSERTIALVTGANKGIGYEIAAAWAPSAGASASAPATISAVMPRWRDCARPASTRSAYHWT